MSALHSSRSSEIEIMDTGGYEPEEIRGSMADLMFYNRWFGGAGLLAGAVGSLLAECGSPDRISILDVGTGQGDIPAELVRRFASRGVEVVAEGLDANDDILREARLYIASGRGRVRLTSGDAKRLPHADRSVDIVVCSNFLHHLESEDALRALGEMKRVSRLGVVAVDLMRSRSALTCVWLLTRLTTFNRLTRNDGPLSVRRAFTPDELSLMAERAGLLEARVRPRHPARMVLTWRASGRS